MPIPSHSSHAPKGLLKENSLGSISSIVKPLSGQANFVENINFSVNKGEIFGIAGLVGAGRTELVRAICGADMITSGKIFVDNNEINISSPQDAIKNGIVMVPEDRKSLGLLLEQSNSQNISIANFDVFLKSSTLGLSPDIIIVTAPCISESEITRVSIGLYFLSLVSKV